MALSAGNFITQQLFGGGTTGFVNTIGAVAIVVFLAPDVGITPALSDSPSNTYLPLPNFPSPGISTPIKLMGFYTLNPITNVNHTWTITGTASISATVILDSVVPGIDAGSSADYFDATADPGLINVTANSIVFAAISSNRTAGIFAGPSGYTLYTAIDSDGNDRYLSVAYKLLPSATEQPTWAGAGFQGGVGVASFSPGSSAPPPIPFFTSVDSRLRRG